MIYLRLKMKKLCVVGLLLLLMLLAGCGLDSSYSQEQIEQNRKRSQMVDDVLSCINTPNDPNCVNKAIAKNDPKEQLITQEYNAIQNEDVVACNEIPDEKKKESCKMNIYINTNDIEKCHTLKNSKSFGSYKDECILRIARELGKVELCDQISDINRKEKGCLKFFENKKSAVIGLNDAVFEGDESNAPEFLKVYLREEGKTSRSEITWWAKDFTITNIYEGSVDGLSGAHIHITTKGGYSTVLKFKLMSDMGVLFDGDTQYGGKFACVDNPSCNGIPWIVKITETGKNGYHFGGSPTMEDQYLYCPETIPECLKLKGWIKD